MTARVFAFVSVVRAIPAAIVLSVSFLAFAPTSAHAYRTLADVEGETSPIIWSSTPTVGLDLTSSFPEDLGALTAVELEYAVAIWNGVECEDRVVQVTRGPLLPEITIRYVPEWAESGFDAEAAATTDLVLQSGPDSGVTLVRATIHLNGTMRWFAHGDRPPPNARDLRTVLVHELGHALALAHNCEPDNPELECGPEHIGAAMHPIYDQGTDARLSQDDVEGICDLYQHVTTVPAVCERTEDCMEAELCRDGECVEDAGYGIRCSSRSGCVSTYCIEEPRSPAGGICTHTCAGDGDCPSGAACAPLAASDLNVCRPRGTAASCNVSAVSDPPPPWPAIVLMGLGLLARYRRKGPTS